jgi:hypothetical protein
MNIPNVLTLLRIFFVPLLVAALLAEDFSRWVQLPVSNEIFALAIFLICAATDLLDGYLARRWKQVTTVGTMLDPIADKLLISSALISLGRQAAHSRVDGDSDCRPRVCRLRSPLDCRCVGLDDQGQRSRQIENGGAGNRDCASDRKHPLDRSQGAGADRHVGGDAVRDRLRRGLFPEVLAQSRTTRSSFAAAASC